MSFARKFPYILVLFILAVGFFLLTRSIDKPFWGLHDWNSVVYSNIARNYVRYGYLETKFGQVTNSDYVDKSAFSYISHYPPLLPVLISFSFRIFGQSEVSARIVIIIFSLVLIFSLFKIGSELISPFAGIISAAFVLFTPLFLYFGKLPVHDTVVPAISAFSFWLYLKFIKTKDYKYYLFMILSLVFGGLINWSAFYLVAALVVHQFIYKIDAKLSKKIFLLVPLSAVIYAVHIFHVRILGIKTSGVFDNFLTRANPFLTADLYGFTVFKYIKQELLYLKIYYTLPLFIGSMLFTFYFAASFLRKRLNLAISLIFSLFVYGIIQLVVFSQLSFIHDYMIYYLFPFMVLSTVYILFLLPRVIKRSFIFPLLLIVISAVSLLTSFKYTQTILATSEHKRGYEAGKLINKHTKSGEKSFIGSTSYKEFEEVFIGYYSDRTVDYGSQLPKDFDKQFKLIVRPGDHDQLDQDSKGILDKNYRKFQNEKFIWYEILN